MANLSQQKRERMLKFLETIKAEHTDDESIIALNEIENELNSKKYGLVWEQHEEAVDIQMRTHVPVFTEVPEREIHANPEDEGYNFLLEGDNLHSLKLLEKTHRGKVDVIYIDPPYNTVNKDFVYDDVYIDGNDSFKHSKWLSFMSERLMIAKNLIKKEGIIAISIGYQEVHNLMVLCNEIFDTKQIVCVTVQTSGGKPNGGFTFVQEYLIFITPSDFSPNSMSFTGGVNRSPFEGLTLSTFDKTTRPNQAYPIFIDNKTMHIVGVGKSLTERIEDGSFTGEKAEFEFDFSEAPEGTSAVFPISSKGNECVWRLIPSRLMRDWEKGYIKVSKNKSKKNPNEYSIQYLPEGVIEKIESGDLNVIGTEEGMPTLVFGDNQTVGHEIPTIWTEKEFFTTKGTGLINEIFNEKKFSYPKPLEFIMEILQGVSKDDSLVLDFFAGSGTTGQAVMELNQKLGGHRRFILCTNNENSICEQITFPRLKVVISGKRSDGSQYSEGLPNNLKYFKTDYITKTSDDDFYSVEEELTKHIKEMIELERGISIDNEKYLLILTDDDADALEKTPKKLKNCKAIYISGAVFLTRKQEALLDGIETITIPQYYFEDELMEVGEL